MRERVAIHGFTLLEISIVLTVVALVAGGLMVGQELLEAGAVRSQLSQISRYDSAVHAFENKYGALPGDMPAKVARDYGFTLRGDNPGEGDGNGLIQGSSFDGNVYFAGQGTQGPSGEPGMVWVDLTSANGLNLNLIDGAFSSMTPSGWRPPQVDSVDLGKYLPAARIGRGNYINAWSGGADGADGHNYYGISNICFIQWGQSTYARPGLKVSEAYAMDRKVDDGRPQTGSVLAAYVSVGGGGYMPSWSAGSASCPPTQGALPGTAASQSDISCYDNGGDAAAPMEYSMARSHGSGLNCAISFAWQ